MPGEIRFVPGSTDRRCPCYTRYDVNLRRELGPIGLRRQPVGKHDRDVTSDTTPPAPKKRKSTKKDCRGTGCGQPDGTSCRLDPDDMDPFLASAPGVEEVFRADRRRQGYHADSPANSTTRRDNEAWGHMAAEQSGSPESARLSGSTPSSATRPVTSAAAAARSAVAMPTDLEQMVDELDGILLRKLIMDIAPSSPQLVRSIKEAHLKRQGQAPAVKSEPVPVSKRKRATEESAAPASTPGRAAIPLSQMTPSVSFDRLSKKAWHALNDKQLLRLNAGRQRAKAEEVWEEVLGCIEEIGGKAKPHSPLQTRRSAIETLRKITKTIVLGEKALGEEVRMKLETNTLIGDIMCDMLMSMTPAERVATGARVEKEESLLEQVRWVRTEARQFRLNGLSRLEEVVMLLESGTPIVVLD